MSHGFTVVQEGLLRPVPRCSDIGMPSWSPRGHTHPPLPDGNVQQNVGWLPVSKRPGAMRTPAKRRRTRVRLLDEGAFNLHAVRAGWVALDPAIQRADGACSGDPDLPFEARKHGSSGDRSEGSQP